jgi:hypothetical protein
LDLAGRYAEGEAADTQLREARRHGYCSGLAALLHPEPAEAARRILSSRGSAASVRAASLIRDVVGNPFRPAPAGTAAWRAWGDGTVVRLARAAYAERPLPEARLEPARLAVLADALEDAGCSDPDLLEHLRGPGPHVRGCWAVDLLQGKE